MGALSLLAVSLGFTTLALAVTRAAGLESLVPELFALTVANLAAAFIRFAILRTWVFRPEFGSPPSPAPKRRRARPAPGAAHRHDERGDQMMSGQRPHR